MKRIHKNVKCLLFLLLASNSQDLMAQTDQQGQYFYKKQYIPAPLPTYLATKDFLPSPVYEDTLLVKTYWKAWELAFRNFHEPTPENGFVSQYIDAAFSSKTFQWDDCFMTMFCNYAYPLVPGIGTKG